MSTPPFSPSPRWSISDQTRDDYDKDGGEGDDDLELLPRPLGHDHPLLSASIPSASIDSGGAGAGEASGSTSAPPEDILTWSPDTFLLSRLPHPPTTMLTELRTYLTSLKHELSELINEDYEEFIGMGIGLRGEGGRLESVEEEVGRLGLGVKVSG